MESHPVRPRATVDGAESPLNRLIVTNPSPASSPGPDLRLVPLPSLKSLRSTPPHHSSLSYPETGLASYEDERTRGIAIDAPTTTTRTATQA